MNYFFPKRTKGLASTREEREQLLRTVEATEYTISGTSSNLSVELFHPTAAGTHGRSIAMLAEAFDHFYHSFDVQGLQDFAEGALIRPGLAGRRPLRL